MQIFRARVEQRWQLIERLFPACGNEPPSRKLENSTAIGRRNCHQLLMPRPSRGSNIESRPPWAKKLFELRRNSDSNLVNFVLDRESTAHVALYKC